jgi:16S rRNA (cytidine1402-2'-O)-methyltransferase
VTTAAAVSGLVNGPFCFLGFIARKSKKRQQEIAFIERSTIPVILFESPVRTPKTLSELAVTMPERHAALCRELTKLHEEVLRGSLAELAARVQSVRGEVTLVVEARHEPLDESLDEQELDQAIGELLAAGHSTKDVTHTLADQCALSRQQLYARVQQLRDRNAET